VLLLLVWSLVPLITFLILAELLSTLVVTLAPVLLVLFACWVVYRLVRRSR